MKHRSRFLMWVLGCGIALVAAMLSSCPAPFDVAVLNQVKDATLPTITVASPLNGTYCADLVQIDGTVTDLASDDIEGGITSLSWEVLGTPLTGDATLSSDGSFLFVLETTTLGETFTLSISATDWNGNVATVSLTLHKIAGDGVPSFAATPDNRSVNLKWQPVPHTASYTVRYTTNGALPSDTVGIELAALSPPLDGDGLHTLDIAGLENGNPHVFQLITVPDPGWNGAVSDYVDVVPLSEQTLAPRVTGRVEGIHVEWVAIPADDTYEVSRSTQINGTYVNLSGPIQGTEYFDTDIVGDQWYYYKVRPANHDNALSAAGAAQQSALTMHEPLVVSQLAFQDLGPDAARGYRVKILDNYAYLADAEAGLQIVDISDPENVLFSGTCLAADRAFDVAFAPSGDYAYVADATAGISVVDISNKTAPSVVVTIDTPRFAIAVEVAGTHLYVSDIDSLEIFDISTENAPSNVGSIGVGALTTVIVGTNLYILCPDATDNPDDFQVYTLTGAGSPASPSRVTAVDSPVNAIDGGNWSMAIQGDYAYVPDRESGLKVIDISDPVNPAYVTTCMTPGWAYDIVVDGPYAFVVAESGGLQIINITDPPNIDDDSIITSRTTHAWGGGLGVARDGQYIYMAEWIYGLSVIKATAPMAPSVVGTLPLLDTPIGVAVRDSIAYVAENLNGLTTVDITVPASPQYLTTLNLVDEVDDVTSGEHISADIRLSGNRAYIADKIKVVDITDPNAPALLGSTYTNGGSWDLDILGGHAYTSNLHVGLNIVDISTDDDPFVTTVRDTTSDVQETAVRGQYAYVADGANGLHVFDVSDTTQIDEVATKGLNGFNSVSIATEDDLAAIVELDGLPYPDLASAAYLHLIDISEREVPATVGAIDLSSPTAGAQEVELAEGFALVVDNDAVEGRLDIFDVSQPGTPFLVGTVSVPNALELTVSGRYAYVTTSAGDLKIIDLLPDL